MPSPPLILPFADIGDHDLPLAGGKGWNLGRLARAGLSVPPGFVVTTEAYRRRDEAAVFDAILAAYRELGEELVAVRSSATAEDLPGASFAGQQATFLNVAGEAALREAVSAAWASLFSERAVAYRRAQGMAGAAVAMALVVQRMVAAEAAGVLFTREPAEPEAPRMVVEATWGLGEALVSGRLTPDRWVLDHATGEALTAAIARKPFRLTAGGEEPLPESLQRAPSLDAAALRELAALGRRVESLYGAPQDVEWAVAGGELFLLQSRPVTAVGQREEVRAAEIERLRARVAPGGTVWARYSLAEVLPEPLPLTWALWRDFMTGRGGYGRMYRVLGYDPDPALDDDGVVELIAGRPYFNLSRDALLYFQGFPYEYPFEKLKADPCLAIYPQPEPNLARAGAGFLLKLPRLTFRMLAAERALEKAAAALPAQLEAEVFPRVTAFARELRALDLAPLSDAECVAAFERGRRELFQEFAPQLLKPGILAGLALGKLEAALRAAGGAPEAGAAEAALAGAAPPPEYDLAAALRQLQAGALSLPDFLDRFGHRGPGEMELSNPRWREKPPSDCGLRIADCGFGDHPSNPPDPSDQSAIRNPQSAIGESAIRNPPSTIERARRFTALRETAKHFLMLGYEGLRRILVELDRRRGLEGGIFYLEPSELPALAAGDDFSAVIAGRRKRRRLALGLEAPRVLFSDDLEALGRPQVAPAAGDVIAGTGVSAGVAEGPALVLRSPDEAPPDAAGFVLVCPSTDPGWVPLFLRARALVLETGGMLSHGAIVAREFGLPAVANLPDACSRIRTGQQLRVDGSAGQVWLSG